MTITYLVSLLFVYRTAFCYLLTLTHRHVRTHPHERNATLHFFACAFVLTLILFLEPKSILIYEVNVAMHSSWTTLNFLIICLILIVEIQWNYHYSVRNTKRFDRSRLLYLCWNYNNNVMNSVNILRFCMQKYLLNIINATS